ncbi:MAG: hypothetical protein PHN72_02540 [Bacilli bacterium]|nr:hypothetical protein [Bacilli bacterium]
MNGGTELIKHIYKDAEMASHTLQKLEKDLKGKDNKIKDKIEELIKKYEDFIHTTKQRLTENKLEPEEVGFLSKIGADMGIHKEVKEDNSDSSIADMLIKGLEMGSHDIEKKIKEEKEKANKEVLKFAYSFLKFQQNEIEELKQFL